MAGDPGTIDEVLAGASAGYVGLSEEIAKLAEQLGQLQAASESTKPNTSASGGSASSPVASTLLDVFGTGLGLSPLITGIASLLGGGDSNPAPDPLVKFALPPSIQVNAGVSESGGAAFVVDHPQGGLPRPAPVSQPAQITVQVQTMDSKSFLDHSGDIAMAVRQAMLESSVLNDVVREA
jgi:hypothetical protein